MIPYVGLSLIVAEYTQYVPGVNKVAVVNHYRAHIIHTERCKPDFSQ